MDARRKGLEMLKTARAERAEALSRGDRAAADRLLETMIDPLKQRIARVTLARLEEQAQELDALSTMLERALADLEHSVDRFFLDRLRRRGRELELLPGRETGGSGDGEPSAPRPRPRPRPEEN